MTEAATAQVATPNDLEIVVTRTFNAPRALVFRAFTEPNLLRRWLLGPPGWTGRTLTMPVCQVDLRVGGKYRYEMEGSDGLKMGIGGTYLEIVPPERLVQTELFDDDWTGGETTNTLLLEERDGKTLMTTIVRYSSKEARDGALQTGMLDGMEMGYQTLDALLREM